MIRNMVQEENNLAIMRREKRAINEVRLKCPLNGYRRLTLMMPDADVMCARSKLQVGEGRLLNGSNGRPSKKGEGRV